MGWIVDGLPRKRGIWYQDDMGWPDLLSKHGGDDDHGVIAAEEHGDVVDDNLYDATRSLDWSLSPMQQLSTLQDIRNSTHLRT